MTVTIRGAKNMIVQFAASNTPASLMFWGLPGVGKTSAVAQATRELGIGFISLISHLYQPMDVLGLPFVWEGRTHYAPPALFPNVEQHGERGILFLDELPNCVQAMQSAWGIVILERSVRRYKFPPGWKIVCAGNPPGTRSGSTRLIGPLENRLTHATIEPSHQEFYEYSAAPVYDAEGRMILPHRMVHAVTDFLRLHPDALLTYDAAADAADLGYASPRSWERVNDLLLLPWHGLRAERNALIDGAIGSKMGKRFVDFLDIAERVDPKRALDGSVRAQLHLSQAEAEDVLSTEVGILLEYAIDHPDAQHVNLVLARAAAMPPKWQSILLRSLWRFGEDPSRGTAGVFQTLMPEPLSGPELSS